MYYIKYLMNLFVMIGHKSFLHVDKYTEIKQRTSYKQPKIILQPLWGIISQFTDWKSII